MINNNEENTDYDIGYFQAIRDVSMIFMALSTFYNAKDLQILVQQIKDAAYKTKSD